MSATQSSIKQGAPAYEELEELGQKISGDWKKLGRRLGIIDETLQEIHQAHDELSEKGYHMLKHWRQKQGFGATYQALCDALQHHLVLRQDLAEQFCYIKDALKIRIDVDIMKSADHNTQDKTPVSAREPERSPVGEHQGVSTAPAGASGRTQPLSPAAEVFQAPYPTATEGEVLCLIAKNYLQTTPPTCKDDRDEFKAYLKEMRVILTGVDIGSLVITVKCDSLEVLKELWEDYSSGNLGEVVQRCFVTEEILMELNLAELKLKTIILEEEYEAYKMYFEKESARVKDQCESVFVPEEKPAHVTGKKMLVETDDARDLQTQTDDGKLKTETDDQDEEGERETPEQVFKIIIIGDSGVGKTCLAHRFATGKFPERTENTIGVDFWERRLELNGAHVRLQIWDTAGQDRFRKSMGVHYYRNVSAVVFMYDITREDSFKSLETWLQEYDNYGFTECDGEVPKLMIGNKCDLIHERTVSSNQARKFADIHKMPMWEISTKNDEEMETIESIFLTLSHKLVRSRSFMDRPLHYTTVDSYSDSTRTRTGKRNSSKKIKLKNDSGNQKKNCCESS